MTQLGSRRFWSSGTPAALFLVLGWVGAVLASSAPGPADIPQNPRPSEENVYVIVVSFSPGFGQQSAEAVCAILKREVSTWQPEFQASRTQVLSAPAPGPAGSVHISICRIVVVLVLWGILLAILGFSAGWVADVRRIPKYHPRSGRVRLRWRLGQCGLIVACVLVVCPLLVDVVTRVPAAPVLPSVVPLPGPVVPSGPWAVVVDGPHASPDSVVGTMVTYPRQEPDVLRLGRQIAETLDLYGLPDIKVVSSQSGQDEAASEKRRLVLHLQTPPRLVLQARCSPGAGTEKILSELREKMPHLAITPSSATTKAERCTLHYSASNPLGAVVAAEMKAVLGANGLAPETVDASTLLEPRILVLVIPSLPEQRLVLHRLPTQDVVGLAARLRQEGIAVMDRPLDRPPLAPGVLYYPVGDNAGTALAAREKADRILRLAYEQGFLGGPARAGWGIPCGREGSDTYELSVVPIPESEALDVLCDKDFDGKLRPIVTRVLEAGDRALHPTFTLCAESPAAEPGVIRFPRPEDRAGAERVRALLSELVGLVNLRVAPTEEPQLPRVSVWLRYDRNGLFHSFVGRLLESMESGARDDFRSLFTAQGWEEDRVTRVEYAPACAKILAYRADDADRDWVTRFVRPWTFRLATWRLQREEGMARWYSVVSARRTLVCAETPAGIRVTAAPEVNDLAPPERFDVVLTGAEEKLRAVLGQFDPTVTIRPSAPGPALHTIYFPENVPEGEAVARMTQALLRDKGFTFSLEPYTPPGDRQVYVVGPAGKEAPDGQP